jgi:hypothetical protein
LWEDPICDGFFGCQEDIKKKYVCQEIGKGKTVGRVTDWRLRSYPLKMGKYCRRIIRIY